MFWSTLSRLQRLLGICRGRGGGGMSHTKTATCSGGVNGHSCLVKLQSLYWKCWPDRSDTFIFPTVQIFRGFFLVTIQNWYSHIQITICASKWRQYLSTVDPVLVFQWNNLVSHVSYHMPINVEDPRVRDCGYIVDILRCIIHTIFFKWHYI